LNGPTNRGNDTENSSHQSAMRKPLDCLDYASGTSAEETKVKMLQKRSSGSTSEYQVAYHANSDQYMLAVNGGGRSHVQAKGQMPPAKEKIDICKENGRWGSEERSGAVTHTVI
jgi:hypothetical protein